MKIHTVEEYMSDGCGRCDKGATPDCKVHQWAQELKFLRDLVLSCGLTETLKWSMPCYTFDDKNTVLISAFKQYCSITFFKGALLKDTQGLLVKQGENTQAATQLQFTSLQEIQSLESTIKDYIAESIEVIKSGIKAEPSEKKALEFPVELEIAFDQNRALKEAFFALTPGRQRAYNMHFLQAKQSKTRTARIEKYTPRILDGIGFNDR